MWMEKTETESIVRGVGRLSVPVVGAYVRSDLSGWKSIISVPEELLNRERNRGLWAIALSGGLLLSIGLLGATLLGRRVVKPIEHLAQSADAYVRGDTMNERLTRPLVETEELANALIRAGQRQRDALTAQENTENQFQRLVQGVSDYALYMLDPDGRVSSWNPGAQHIKGYSQEEIIGKHFSGFYTEEDRLGDVPGKALRTAAEKGRYEAEGWRVRKDGGRFWANVVIDRILDSSGRIVGYAKITRDATYRREAEEKLKAAREQLFQSQKMEAVGHLTGGVAHDFNNLLTIIIGNLDAARRSLENWQEGAQQRLAHQLNNAMQGAQRAATLTSQLLAFARRQPLEPRALDINKFLRTIADFLRPSLGETVQLEVVGAGGVWAVEVDQNQFETAILNLAVNARDAMPDGGKLTIDASNVFLDEDYCARHSDVMPGQYVAISVTDNGSGMDKKTLDHAFEPFFTTKETGKGTGLGLSQVYGFVKQSGGHIKIYSEVGEGTTVRLYLKRTHGENATHDVTRSTAFLTEGTETILLVEDDSEVREFISETLRELGYSVIEAPEAETALRLLEQHEQIDLLLTDVVLPGVNGRQLADRVRSKRTSLKVLFMTGYSRNAIVHQGRLDPGVEFIQKPLTQGSLAARIRAVLDGRM